MACDQNYAPYALFLACQIAQEHPVRDFDICIFSEQPLEIPETLQHLGVKTETIRGENPFRNSPNLGRHGAAAYLRLLIPPQVEGRYKRLLYLDSDIFLCQPGVDRLFKVDMLGAPVAAVRDNTQWRTPKRLVREFKVLGLPTGSYFNSGVLLIDVARYQTEAVLDNCLRVLAAHPEALLRHDQSLLNIVLKGRWTELSPVWNWQYTWSSRFFTDMAEPRLIHFIGPHKVWKDTINALPARYRRAYAVFVRLHYPGRSELAPVEEDAMGWPTGVGKMFLKHLLSAGRMKKYLCRFTYDTTTHRVA